MDSFWKIANRKVSSKFNYVVYLLVICILIWGTMPVHSTYDRFNLGEDELRNNLKLARNNNIEAILRVADYYTFALSDENKTFDFLSKYAKLKNSTIQHNMLMVIAVSKGNKSHMQKRMKALKQLANSKYLKAIFVSKYLIDCKIIDKDYNILDIEKLNRYLHEAPQDFKEAKRLKNECSK